MTGHLSDEEYDEIQRAKTVNKYETGDPGSDEDEHLESIENRETDQFGFYRNPRFLKFETQKLKSKSRQTKRREKKWEKMAKDFPKAMNKKLKSRTYKGYFYNPWTTLFHPFSTKKKTFQESRIDGDLLSGFISSTQLQ